jgi:hypothetical protein
MAEMLTDAQIREVLDRHYPLIDPNSEPPGRWQAYEDGRPGQRWKGQSRWSVRHGQAIVRWGYGKPEQVSGASLTDGTHVDVSWWVGDGWRYPASRKPRRWIHGTIDIQADRVMFTPGEQPKYVPPTPSEHPSLYVDLAGHVALRDRLLDEDFADALYAYLQNREFFKEGGDRIWLNGQSELAGFVANLRGQGDVYTDYYPHGGQLPRSESPYAMRANPQLTPEEALREEALTSRVSQVKIILSELGWRLPTAEDRNVAGAAARRDLAAWEARPAGAAPDWVAKIQAPRPPPPGAIRLRSKLPGQMTDAESDRDREIATQALPKRLHALATSGRITEDEYREMVGRISRIP